MRAIRAAQFGSPAVLEPVELPTPEPAEGELRVAVAAAGVSWMDALIRRGEGPAVFAVEPPYVPGSAVAGTVTSIGAGVDGDWLGKQVVTHATGGYGGGYADTAISSLEHTFPVPSGLDPEAALAVLDDGATALALLEKTPVRPGERVLVAPGLGGLGNLLVQLAVAAGAEVIAAVRGAEKAAVAGKLGVETVDYSTPDWATRSVDVVFDGIGGSFGAAALALLPDGGRYSGYGMTSGAEAAISDADRRRLTVVDMTQLPEFWPDTGRRVTEVLRRTAVGELTPLIGRTYPLTEAATAHADIEARRFIGKLLLLP